MARNIILRPVYNRPEMLKLSIEYEIAAREYHRFPSELLTVFLIEHGSPQETIDLVKSYPYPSALIQREQKLGLTINILEGMRQAFELADEYLIHLEDDILLHKTYFQYMHEAMMGDLGGPFSVISAYNQTDGENPSEVYLGHHYAALAPLINKNVWEKYMKQLACEDYYKNPAGFVVALNEQYKKHWGGKYKYKNYAHWEQAGLWNRVVDVALIEDNAYVLMPKINRQQHIGFYGKNRVMGTAIPGNSFDERVESLREIIIDADRLYTMAGSKQYDDYKVFSPKLDAWDGRLGLV